MKIILIGNNNTHLLPENGYKEPYHFMKPDSALQKNNKPFFIPDFTQSVSVSLHPVIHISKLGKNIAERFAYRYYDSITTGLDITASDLLQKCKENALPWEVSCAFDASAIIGNFLSVEKFQSIETLHLKLNCDGNTVQQDTLSCFQMNIDQIIADISRYYTLKTGDLIYMGALGNTEVQIGRRLQGYLENDELFDFHIR
jgi:2-keto-4-pentenoate hydratase/2-oxohepta-3-ene-1,7-dioic acid hydratase in catechol pathway